MNAKQILGTVTIVAVIGGVTYGIIKARKMKKAEENAISMDEAMSLVANAEKEVEFSDVILPENINKYAEEDVKLTQDFYENMVEAGHVTVGPIEVDGVPHSFVVQPYKNEPFVPEEEEDEEEIEIDYFPEDHGRPLSNTITEEDKVLRHHPDSVEALQQYIRMELAEWAVDEEVFLTMARLFDFPFQPQNDGDHMLRTQIIDERVRFFGFSSKWAQQVTFAEVILHYAKDAHYNCNETVRYWVEYFLEFVDVYHGYSSQSIDEVLIQLNEHGYYNSERQTFGLFGLTREAMDNAIAIANRNVDNNVTFAIEFNEFLKSTI